MFSHGLLHVFNFLVLPPHPDRGFSDSDLLHLPLFLQHRLALILQNGDSVQGDALIPGLHEEDQGGHRHGHQHNFVGVCLHMLFRCH